MKKYINLNTELRQQSKNKKKYYRCLHCNNCKYKSLNELEEHIKRCKENLDDIEEIMPKKDETLKFENYHHQCNHNFLYIS